MPTAASQVNKVYAEVVTDSGVAPATRAQKLYAEVITDNGIAAQSRVVKLYVEVIGDIAAPPVTASPLPVIMACT
ncbi:UNVERIFIED_ORG: hypothetical protein BDU10_8598 [Burkholderia sp. CF145]